MRYVFLLLSFGLFAQNNYALQFGSGNYLYKAIANYRSGDNAGTISVWVKRTDATNNGAIFSSGNETGSSNFIKMQTLDVAGSDYLTFVVDDPTTRYAYGNTAINIDSWHHYVVTSDGIDWIFWVDGVNQAVLNTVSTPNGKWYNDIGTLHDNVLVGAMLRTSLDDPFVGLIDELAYFDAPKDQAWVTATYNGGVPTDLSGDVDIVDYWRFEEGAGITTAPTVGSITFQFGDGSTPTTYPSWTTDTPGWDAGDMQTNTKWLGWSSKWLGW